MIFSLFTLTLLFFFFFFFFNDTATTEIYTLSLHDALPIAHSATPGALAEAKRRMEAAEQAARDAADRAQENAALLSRTVLTIPQPAGEDGRLFGSVTSEDIVNAIKQ